MVAWSLPPNQNLIRWPRAIWHAVDGTGNTEAIIAHLGAIYPHESRLPKHVRTGLEQLEAAALVRRRNGPLGAWTLEQDDETGGLIGLGQVILKLLEFFISQVAFFIS